MNINFPEAGEISGLKALWHEAFGDGPEAINSFFDTAFSFRRSMRVAEEGDICAALYWLDCLHMGKPVAYIYAVATAAKYRGRGICSSMMEHTRSHLAEKGYAGAVLVPSQDGLFGFYEKLGYSTCSSIGELSCTASGAAADIRRVDREEYALLRRQFLPKGGVVQENENIDYLLTHGQLYAGDSFLLAARREGSTLFGIELLGNKTAAGDILSALGCHKGVFRTSGTDRRFAMYLPLDVGIAPPEYFGLAFDI